MKARGVSITGAIRSIPKDPRANHRTAERARQHWLAGQSAGDVL